MALEDPQHLLSIFDFLPIHPIERVSFVGGYADPHNLTLLNYIGQLGTVRELSIDLSFLTTFVTFIGQEGDTLQTAADEGAPGEMDNPQDEEKFRHAQNILSFHGLQSLKIYGDLREGYPLGAHDALNLQVWLDWRNRFKLRLEKLSISSLTAPPISWLHGVFNELVGELQTENLDHITNVDVTP